MIPVSMSKVIEIHLTRLKVPADHRRPNSSIEFANGASSMDHRDIWRVEAREIP